MLSAEGQHETHHTWPGSLRQTVSALSELSGHPAARHGGLTSASPGLQVLAAPFKAGPWQSTICDIFPSH